MDLILWEIVGEYEVTGEILSDILFQLYSFSGTCFRLDGSMPNLFNTSYMSGSDESNSEIPSLLTKKSD